MTPRSSFLLGLSFVLQPRGDFPDLILQDVVFFFFLFIPLEFS